MAMAGSGAPSTTRRPRLVARPSRADDRCRCGRLAAPESSCYEIVDVPRELSDWILGRSFCGVACARAYLRETLDPLENAVGGQATIGALRQVLASLERIPGSD